jgi:cytochrome bd-type quinol oxidase subunit 2
MSATRRLASRLLRAVARHSSSDSQDWANAMLRELDFIESDWAALFWALGSTAAIFRHSVPRAFRAWLEKRHGQTQGLRKESIGKKAAGVTAGIVIVLAVTSFAFALVRQLFYAFPAWDLGSMPWWVAMIVIPEITFVVTAVAIWRKRRSMATGILLSAIVLAVHFVVHAATHVH